jgi:hypothetical protein
MLKPAPGDVDDEGRKTAVTHLVSKTLMLFLTLRSATLIPNLAREETAAARTMAFSRMTRL